MRCFPPLSWSLLRFRLLCDRSSLVSYKKVVTLTLIWLLTHREGEDSAPSCALHPGAQAGSSHGTTVPEFMEHLTHPHDPLPRDGTVEWDWRGNAPGGIWHTYLTKCNWCFESLSTQLGLLFSPRSERTIQNQRRQREQLLLLLHPLTQADILLPVPWFWPLLFGALGSHERFVSTREDSSGPKKTEIETFWPFYH